MPKENERENKREGILGATSTIIILVVVVIAAAASAARCELDCENNRDNDDVGYGDS